MAEEETQDEGQPNTPRRAKRTPPTIDLSATEVSDAGAAEKAGAASEAQSAASQTSAENEMSSPPSSGDRNNTGQQRGGAAIWPIAAAAIVGGLVSAGIIVGLTAAGVIAFNDPRSADILARLDSLEAKLASPPQQMAAPNNKALDAIDARISKLESQITTAQGNADPALATRLGSVELAAKSAAETAAGLAAAVQSIRTRTEAIAKTLDELQAADKGERAKLADRVSALENSVRAVEEKIETPGSTASDRDMRSAILSSALKDAVERGAPFKTELEAAASLGIDPKWLTALEPFASSGVPTASALASELTALIPALRRAADVPSAKEGFFARLQSNASKLVRVEPVNEPTGSNPLDIVQRVERDAARADVAGARADLARLPSSVQEIAAGWIAKTQARDAALTVAHAIAADALKSLTAPGRQP